MPPSGANHTAAAHTAANPTASAPLEGAGARAARGADSSFDLVVDLAAAVDLGVDRESVTLSSGRRYELEAGDCADRLVVRSRSGQVLLRLEVGERGPVLSFDSAEVELRARDRLKLSAPELTLRADDKLTVECGGDVEERIAGDHHTCVQGDERLEAGSVQLQANDDDVKVRAVNTIALDGEHIGLNDEPCPTPFDWSAIADEHADGGAR